MVAVSAIERIIQRFPFDAVAEHMRSVGWTWTMVGHPTCDDMIVTVRGLYERAKATGMCGTGGFVVLRKNGDVIVEFSGKGTRGKKGPGWREVEPETQAASRECDRPDGGK
jgi:hypothetical protein